jgi:hypothetical protein
MSMQHRATVDRSCAADHRRAAMRAVVAAVAFLPIAACSGDSTRPEPVLDCVAGRDAETPAVGAVITGISGTAACVGGGSAGAQYVLIPFNADTLSAKRTFQVQATGVVAPTSASLAIQPGANASAILSQLGSERMVRRDVDFEERLRARERSLSRLIPAARRRAALRSQTTGASRAVIPANVAVGQLLELNTNADDPCENPVFATGRVVALTPRSIVVADTTNPTGGFTDEDFRQIAKTFDEVVDPVNTANFGEPADIDNNDRILLFFTRSVNAMTPADNKGSYVGGFFYGRDLFPTASTRDLEGCPSSNFGELFYLLVPDPTGIVNNNKFSTTDVREIAISIVAHEYQHLINTSRRIYVSTTARELEVGWLNEGLSHIAEELLFYAQSGFAPREDLDPPKIRKSQRTLDAFNNDMGANFGRYQEYLENTAENSPWADNDSLATRGATWSLLRYAADQKGGTQASTWKALVNGGPVGFANLERVFGTSATALTRNWATTVFTDNLAGVSARYQQPSWNFRAIFPLITDPSSFPLKTVTLADGVSQSVSLVGGGSAYLRFQVPAGGDGRISWGSLPSKVQMTVVRTR